MSNSNLFGSPFSSSNPFSNGTTPSLDSSLAESYARLEALKKQYNQNGQPMQQQSTVFSDIQNELKNLSEDESQFITNSKEYQAVNQKYQAEFSNFLINKFAIFKILLL